MSSSITTTTTTPTTTTPTTTTPTTTTPTTTTTTPTTTTHSIANDDAEELNDDAEELNDDAEELNDDVWKSNDDVWESNDDNVDVIDVCTCCSISNTNIVYNCENYPSVCVPCAILLNKNDTCMCSECVEHRDRLFRDNCPFCTHTRSCPQHMDEDICPECNNYPDSDGNCDCDGYCR